MNNIFYNRAGNKIIKPSNKKTTARLAVYGILIKNNQVLLVQPLHSEKWEFPGGKVDDGESELDALKREILEEAGYKLNEVSKCVFSRIQNYYADNIDQFFDSRQKFFIIKKFNKIKNCNKIDQSEIKKIKWFPLEYNLIHTIRNNQAEIIQNILTNKF